MIRLLLVRHGQSTWNADGRWQGQADPPLSDLGRRQAADATAAIGAVDAVFSSTLERARHTAEIISEGIGVGPVVSLPDLVERNAGEWQGMTRAQIDEQYPGYLAADRRPPGWEPNESLCERALRAIGRIVEGVGGGDVVGGDVGADVLVVTHGGLIYEVERSLGAPFQRMGNLESRWLVAHADRLELGDRVHLLSPAEETVPEQI